MHSTEPGVFMRISRLLLLATVAAAGWAQTPVWDTAGNKMLNGTYYFRDVTYVLSNTGDGSLYDALAVYGTATFDGAGKYTMAVSLLDGRAGNIFTRRLRRRRSARRLCWRYGGSRSQRSAARLRCDGGN